MVSPTPVLEPFHKRYEDLAVRIGLTGNALFVLGSILFMTGPRLAATLCWLFGSLGMLVRAVGRLYVDHRDDGHQHGRDGGEAMAAARRQVDTAPE